MTDEVFTAAYELGLAPSASSAHLARAAAELGASARAELVRLVRTRR